MNDYPAGREPVIETVKLSKVFKDFWHRDKVKALNGLSMQVFPGEVFGLLGPNGSGKTTTLKLMLGLLFPTSGIVRIFGRSPRNVAVKSRIGFLPEDSYFYRHLSADETMDFYGSLFEIPSNDRVKRGRRLLEMLGLTASHTRPVGEYSKGMLRRIGLAQALINDPELVILDEPTSGLDPIGRREVKNLILDLKKLGKTVLLSSHLLSEVQDVCDRICILYGGKKIAEGGVGDVLLKKNTTQVSFSAVSDDKLKNILDYARSQADDGRVAVSNPVETLEEFFLREIAKLDEGKKRLSAASGAAPAEKLSILEELTKEEPHPCVEENAASGGEAEPEEKPKPDVLDDLVRGEEPRGASRDSAGESASDDPDAKKDEVFRKLLGDDKE